MMLLLQLQLNKLNKLKLQQIIQKHNNACIPASDTKKRNCPRGINRIIAFTIAAITSVDISLH